MEDRTRQVAQEVFQTNAWNGQFGVAMVPAHTHNGTDSLQVSFSNLADRLLIDSYTIPGTSASSGSNYSIFYLASFPCTVLGLKEVHAVKGTDGSAVTLNIEKLTGTTAPGAGTAVLSTAFDLKGNINTVQTGTLTTVSASKNLAVNDRLAFLLSGTPTSVANVTVSVVLGI